MGTLPPPFYLLLNDALEIAREQLSLSELSTAIEGIEKAKNYQLYQRELAKDTVSPFYFVRIIKRNSKDGRFMFGSKVKALNYNEMQICPAIHDGETWIPDENNPTATVNMTDSSFTDVIMNHTNPSGFPVTIESFLGHNVPQEDAVFADSSKQIRSQITTKENIAKFSVSTVLDEAIRFQDSSVKMNKSEMGKLIQALEKVEQVAYENNDFDLNCAVEMMEKDAQNLRFEIISNVLSKITKLSSNEILRLENKGDIDTGPYNAHYHFWNDRKLQKVISKIVQIYAVQSGVDKDDVKSLKELISNLERRSKYFPENDELTRLRIKPSYGLLRMGRPSGGTENLFGDVRFKSYHTDFTLSLARFNVTEYGDIKYDIDRRLLKFVMSPGQTLELIQGSSTGLWVKATMSHIMQIKLPDIKDEDHEKHDKLNAKEQGDLPAEISVKEKCSKLLSLIQSKGSSKAKREGILALAKDLKNHVDKMNECRDDDFVSRGVELKNTLVETERKSLNVMLESITRNHPEIKQEVLGYLEDGILKIESK